MAADAVTAGSPDAPLRALVGGCALLLVGDVERADRLSQTVLARQAAAATPYPLVRVLRELVRARAVDFEPPWVAGARVQLRDTGPGASSSPLVVALQALPVESRAALVLSGYAGLSGVEVAEALEADGPTVQRWAEEARRELASQRPDRWSAGRLDQELRAAAARALVSGSPATDVSHGRLLARRRGLRRTAAAAATALVLVLGAVAVLDRGPEIPQATITPDAAAPPPTPARTGPEPRAAACDVRDPLCQATVVRRWRATMSEVVVSHLDPEGSYFTGYSFSYNPHYESRSFWAGGRGALGLEVARLGGGATEVYLQVASGYDTAVRCGATTGHRCEGQRGLDGYRFTQSTTTQGERGIEVQHRPDGDQVITVVARNTTRGPVLDVTRADLIELVQDPRLRLPVI